MRTLLALIGLVASSTVFAGSVGPATIFGNQVQVIGSSQLAYVYATVTGGGCSHADAAVLIMGSSNPAANALYAALLSAKTTGTSITITTSGCSAAGYPVIDSIYLN